MVPIKKLFLAASLCGVTMICLLMSIIPGATGGRLGIIAISGDSMATIPYASRVLVLPLRARPGDVVTAWGSLDHPESPADCRPCLLVKLYDGQRLVSTGTGQTCSDFELRGRVMAVIPVQKLCPRLSRRSNCIPSPLYKPRTLDEQRQVLQLALLRQHHLRRFLASGDARWRALDNITLRGLTKQVRVVNLPEPCSLIGLYANIGPQAEIRVCAGSEVIARYAAVPSEVQSVEAPAGKRLDRLVLVILPTDGIEQHATLTAVRRLDLPAEQLCSRAE